MNVVSTFDDVAAAATSGAAPIVIAIVDGLSARDSLADWLERAVPVYGPYTTERVAAGGVLARLDSGDSSANVLVVTDAASGRGRSRARALGGLEPRARASRAGRGTRRGP